jgi:signal transduction histidine kinase/ActR/RegA family two-component response regulator
VFKRLHTKFAVLYVVLFTGVLALIASAVFIATTRNVQHMVHDQLLASGVVFDNLSANQRSRMQEEADVLSRDFGFRSAVATNDVDTVRSALDNLAARSGLDLALVVGLDGALIGRTTHGPAFPASALDAVQKGADYGVVAIRGQAYEIVAAPLLTPAPAGYVVFARAIGPTTLNDLDKLSSLPLRASLALNQGGHWTAQGGGQINSERNGLSAMTTGSLGSGATAVAKVSDAANGSLLLIRRLPGLGGGSTVALVLRCPLGAALRPFYDLGVTIAAISGLGLLLIVAGSWCLARTLTRPIFALEDAVRRLQHGEEGARVIVTTHDELARLGQSFNAMADEIVGRQASLTRALAAAEAANQAKDIFLSNMNHEFRTPLNGVVGVAGMMGATSLDANQRQMVEIIESSGAALQRILNDVLDMVDIGSNNLELADKPFGLTTLLVGLTDLASSQAVAKGLNFQTAVSIDEDVWVRGDADRVRQILNNLLDNAVKFTAEGEVSFVADSPSTGVYRFEVKDTGIGFDPVRVEELFTAFHQVDGSMTRRAGGTGLGLSLAREIARAMGGDIVGHGAPGEGAVFVFTLPLAPAAQPVSTPQEQLDEAPAEPSEAAYGDDAMEDRPVRILLADDHASNRTIIEMILSGLDTEVVGVENGLEALEAFKQQDFDIVLMDLQMPVMDGLTAIRLIREHEAATAMGRTPILVISANVQAAHLRASAEAGADSHLAKPILAPALIQALNDHLSGGSDPNPGAVVAA